VYRNKYLPIYLCISNSRMQSAPGDGIEKPAGGTQKGEGNTRERGRPARAGDRVEYIGEYRLCISIMGNYRGGNRSSAAQYNRAAPRPRHVRSPRSLSLPLSFSLSRPVSPACRPADLPACLPFCLSCLCSLSPVPTAASLNYLSGA